MSDSDGSWCGSVGRERNESDEEVIGVDGTDLLERRSDIDSSDESDGDYTLNCLPDSKRFVHQGLKKHPCVRIFGHVTKNERSGNKRDAETIEEERCSLKLDLKKIVRDILFWYPRCFNFKEKRFTKCVCLQDLSDNQNAVANTSFEVSLMERRDRQFIVKEAMRSASLIKQVKSDAVRVYVLTAENRHYAVCKDTYQNIFGLLDKRWYTI